MGQNFSTLKPPNLTCIRGTTTLEFMKPINGKAHSKHAEDSLNLK